MNANTALDKEQVRWAYTKWCEGYTLLQIAEALNVCEKTIRRAINGKPRIRPILHYDKSEKIHINKECQL